MKIPRITAVTLSLNDLDRLSRIQEKLMSRYALKILLVAALQLALFAGVASAAGELSLSRGQTLYVPVYSNIYSAPKKIPFNLSATLSIRNTDMANTITVVSADYHDTRGKLVKRYYLKPLTLGPLESTDIYIPEEDTSGGIGANFIVTWSAQSEVNAPIVEAVMIGMKSGQGISFVSPSREIRIPAK